MAKLDFLDDICSIEHDLARRLWVNEAKDGCLNVQRYPLSIFRAGYEI
jgi:hypothetical protein